MKSQTIFGLLFIAAAFVFGLWPSVAPGQAGADDPLLAPLIDEITKQQTVLTENQAKIDEKLAGIAEDLRIARIFVARGGGKVK